MLISKPLLPPKKGYVEVVDSEGNHVYKKLETPESLQLDNLETRTVSLESQATLTDESLISLYESQSILEEQLSATDEVAIMLFESQAVQEESIAELYEIVGGLTNAE